jgi:glucokinase
VVGIDLGGTRLRLGLVDANGTVHREMTVPSSTGLPRAANLDYLCRLIEGLLADPELAGANLRGIGVGATGPLDPATGRIDNPHTLPEWTGLDLGAALRERFAVPVRFENDAAVAALGEYWLGGEANDCMMMITIGTGVGGALIVDGENYNGAAGFHPEMGHLLIDPSGPLCYCGASGCLESLIAGPALARAWNEVLSARDDQATVGGSEGLFAAARVGDQDATRLVNDAGRHLGLGLITLTALLAPGLIVVGGGIGREFDLLIPMIRTTLASVAHYHPIDRLSIRPVTLGESAGILGAAYLAWAAD